MKLSQLIPMSCLLTSLLLSTPLVANSQAQSQSNASTDANVSTQATSTEKSKVDMTAGEIRKVDKEAKKITIKHAAIKNLEMPPMTMVFQVKEEALLNQVKQGDKVQFAAEKIEGAFVVTAIQGQGQ